MRKDYLILLVCAILGASAIVCTGILCLSHRYYCATNGVVMIEVDRLTGDCWRLYNDQKQRIPER